MSVVITWTKNAGAGFSSSDDGSILSGADIGNIQTDIEGHSHDSVSGSMFIGLANIPAGAGDIPSANLDGNGVVLTGDQTITGIKTFSSMPILPARFKVGSFTRDSAGATGTQAVTGVGFTPKAVIFFACDEDVAGEMSVGIDDGTLGTSLADTHNILASSWATSAASSIRIYESSGAYYSGVISSFDADGFTISWTKTGSPTGIIVVKYLAFR